MTSGYADWLRGQGATVYPPRAWRIEWLTFRLHPCHCPAGVEMYREMIRQGEENGGSTSLPGAVPAVGRTILSPAVEGGET